MIIARRFDPGSGAKCVGFVLQTTELGPDRVVPVAPWAEVLMTRSGLRIRAWPKDAPFFDRLLPFVRSNQAVHVMTTVFPDDVETASEVLLAIMEAHRDSEMKKAERRLGRKLG